MAALVAHFTFVHDHDCDYKDAEVHREIVVGDDGALDLPNIVCADTHAALTISHAENTEI